MTSYQIATIAGSTLLLGVIRVCYEYYKEWKADRALLPADVRNAGFWTDLKLLVIERSILTTVALYVMVLLAALVWLVGGEHGLWCWPYCPL